MKIGSLFSGVGGLDMAVTQAFGGSHAWFSEIDKAASKVLTSRFPGVPNLGDITTTVDWDLVEPVDVLCGGWPCQPFSLAGKRKGIDDERALWPNVAGVVRALRPRFVVLENVSAVLTAGEFDRVAADLAACGYSFGWTCARASDVGAPHRRERLFIVATAADSRSGRRDSRITGAPIQGRPSGGFTDCRVSTQASGGEPGLALLPTPRTSDRFGAGRHGDGGMDLRTTVTLLPTAAAADGSGGGVNAESDMSESAGPNCARSKGDKLRDLVKPMTEWGKYEPAIRRWEQVTGQPAPAPTEPNKNGKPRLSAAFSEWLMGWPAGWVTDPAIGISRSDQLRCVGNGVVTLQAAAAIRYLLAISELVPSQ